MKKRSRTARRQLLLAGLGALAAPLGGRRAAAQDPAQVMPRAYRVLLENERVRVVEYTSRPGMGICGEGMHSHPARVNIVMSGWRSVASRPGSAARAQERKDGEVFWRDAETHKVENVGASHSRVLMVELKDPPKGRG